MEQWNIGRYELRSRLGHGGMADVYLATDTQFGRDVAVKVMPEMFLRDPTFHARFEREARLIASLEHPAIVPVYDFGEYNGQPFLVMRLMSGGSLADIMREHTLSPGDSIRILSQVADGLEEAHRQGIVHRDLKPGNILFDSYGNALLADFGLGKVIEQTGTLTGSGMIGTPAYMSPEQVQGDKNLNHLSDIYSLGVILYEMLTGEAPYEADTPMGMAVKHVLEPVPSVRSVNGNLPDIFDAVIVRSMAKDPADRYQSAAEMMADLLTAAEIFTDAPTEQTPAFQRPTTSREQPTKPLTLQSPSPQTQPSRKTGLPISVIAGAGAGILSIIVVGVLLLTGAISLPWGNSKTGPTSGFASVIDVQGEVQYMDADGEVERVRLGQLLPVGADAVIATGSEAQVGLLLTDGSTVRLAPDTALELTEVADPDTGAADTRLRLISGSVLTEVDLYPGNTFGITHPGEERTWAEVYGSVMGTEYTPGTDTFDVDCFEGHCRLHWFNGIIDMEADQFVSYKLNDQEPKVGIGARWTEWADKLGFTPPGKTVAEVESPTPEPEIPETGDETQETEDAVQPTATRTPTPTSTPTPTATTPPANTNLTYEVFDVYFCRYIGDQEFEWYKVQVTYDKGTPVAETVLGGPYTGTWQPRCPAAPPTDEPDNNDPPLVVTDPPTSMHVDSVYERPSGLFGPDGRAGILVKDNNGDPVSGVTVTGSWNKCDSGCSTSCVTGSDGICSIDGQDLACRGTNLPPKFTLSNISGSLPYNSGDNGTTSFVIGNYSQWLCP